VFATIGNVTAGLGVTSRVGEGERLASSRGATIPRS